MFLQNRNQNLIALTARSVSQDEDTWRQLAELEIDFTRTAVRMGSFAIATKARLPARYRQGICFSENNDKGDVLLSFLAQVGHQPEKVVFIDDREKNINKVRDALRGRIAFTGLWYRAADELVPDFTNSEIARAIVERQWQVFIDKGKILSDAEAKFSLQRQGR